MLLTRISGSAALVLLAMATMAQAQTPDPIRYTVAIPAPHTHYLEVTASVPSAGQPAVELMMAAWTPGSYLVRDYARHVEALTAHTEAGAPLAVEKSARNRWRVQTGGTARVQVAYRVYGREMSVRTNWVDASFALINGAPTFLTLAGGGERVHEVEVRLPSGWARVLSAMPSGGTATSFRAASFDELVDSPLVAGNPAVYEFVVNGTPHALVNVGEDGVFDGARAAKDLERVVAEHGRFWGGFPYQRYLFFNLITEAGGGLEHAACEVQMTSRWATRTPKAYRAWLELASHEHFHAWNVKRLRPVELGPFDYERENPTRSLWVVEGITDYYGDLAVHRAGLVDQKAYFEDLSGSIKTLQTTGGRLVQPLTLASYDAWIRYYRPDENSGNVAISYYTKGYVVAWLLDARIRDVTGGARSLDDVMRLAFQRYSGARGYALEQFHAVAEEVAGRSLADFWAQTVFGTAELDYTQVLALFGLRFKKAEPPPEGKPVPAWLGITTTAEGGRLLVTKVERGGPAHQGGLNVDDEILAIDDFRVTADQLTSRLEQYAPGTPVTVLVSRRGRLERLAVTSGRTPVETWAVEADPAATADQKARLAAWLAASKAR